MKARAASPDVLVDLNGLEELRGIGSPATGRSTIGAMTTYTELMRSAEAKRAGRSSPRSARTIADVQVRNRGTIGGNVCSNDPTNHLPPLMVALGATMTIVGAGGERDGLRRGVLPRRLHDRRRAGRAADAGSRSRPARSDGFAAVTIGAEGTCIVQRGRDASNGDVRVAIGCVDAVPVRRHRRRPTTAESPTPCARRTSTRRPTSTPRASTAATSPRCSRSARPRRRAATLMDVTVTVNGTTYEREVEARQLLDPLPARRPRPDRAATSAATPATAAPARVIVDGTLVKSCMLLAVQADGASIETVEGLAEDGELHAAPAGVQRAPRAPVRLLHAGDADERDRAPAREPEPDRGRDQEGAPGQHLPLHRLLEHRRGGQGGWRSDAQSETTVAPSAGERRRRAGRASVTRKEDQRLVQGEGVLRRRREAARDGLPPLRALPVRARAHHDASTSRRPRRSTASTAR